jgi:hypothetical protein
MEKIMRIICVGNTSEATDRKTKIVAEQYGLEYKGRLNEHNWQSPGCGSITILKDLSLDQWRRAADLADMIIVLDQSPESYADQESWQKSQIAPRWLAHFKSVIYENHNQDLFITKDLVSLRDFHVQHVSVQTNHDVFKQVYNNNLTDRRVVLQFMNLQQQDVTEFLEEVHAVIQHCRKSCAKFIVFRNDPHEPDPLHFKITRHFCQYPEFLLLQPSNIADLPRVLDQHWIRLYHKQQGLLR